MYIPVVPTPSLSIIFTTNHRYIAYQLNQFAHIYNAPPPTSRFLPVVYNSLSIVSVNTTKTLADESRYNRVNKTTQSPSTAKEKSGSQNRTRTRIIRSQRLPHYDRIQPTPEKYSPISPLILSRNTSTKPGMIHPSWRKNDAKHYRKTMHSRKIKENIVRHHVETQFLISQPDIVIHSPVEETHTD